MRERLEEASVAAKEAERRAQERGDRLLRRDAKRLRGGRLEVVERRLHDLPAGVRDRLSRRARAILGPIVAAGHASGTIRPDLDTTDLLVVVRMLGGVSAPPSRRAGDRYLAIVLRGLAG